MIEVHSNIPRGWTARLFKPIIFAVFSFRYDAHLVPDLLANIQPLVDGWVSWDDRLSSTPFTYDTVRRQALIEAAHNAGAQWILAVDPDERFEGSVEEKIRYMARLPGRVCWTFDLRELYAPDRYRTDGIWGRKRQKRLFRIFDHQFPIQQKGSFQSRPLHDHWVPPGYLTLHSNLNLYHLKMIDPMRRQARSALYSALDPDLSHQEVGYAYLCDETGATFQAIPPGRVYKPGHRDDGGPWMADPADLGTLP